MMSASSHCIKILNKLLCGKSVKRKIGEENEVGGKVHRRCCHGDR